MCEPEGWLLQQPNYVGTSRSGLGENNCRVPDPAACGDDTACIAHELNLMYMGFSENNPSSPLGVTVRMANDFHIWCGGDCVDGFNDCRVSASVFNHRVMIMHDSNNIAVTMGRSSGIIFNQEAVETNLGKCSYMFDGATFSRVNMGCGCHSHHHHCSHPESPWYSTATGQDSDVEQCTCDSENPRSSNTPERTIDVHCLWSGPALDSHGGSSPNQLREMILQRIASQEAQETEDVGESDVRYRSEYWNEIVLDGTRVLAALDFDIRSVVTAFVYIAGSHGRAAAERMSQQAAHDYGGSPIPVIELNPLVDGSVTGPFQVQSASLLEITSELQVEPDASADATEWIAETSALLEHASAK